MHSTDKSLSVDRTGARTPGRGISRYAWFSLLFLWLIYALNANSRQMIFYVLPSITDEFNTSPTELGMITGAVTAATALIAIPTMLWVDRGGRGWKRKYRHLPIVIGYALFTFLTGFDMLTITLGGLLVLQLISHAIAGAGESVEVTSAAEWWPRERRGFALGIHHTGFPWGTLIGGIIVAALLGAYGASNWRLPFLLFPIPVIVVFAGYWWFATKQRYAALVDHLDAAGETKPVDTDQIEHTTATTGALMQCLRNPNISVIAGIGLFATIGYIGLSFWLPQYLAFVAQYDFAKAAAFSVVFTITGGLGMIGWGWISDRLGRKLSLIIVFLWLAVGFFLFQNASVSVGWLIGVQLFTGLAINAPYTLVYAIAIDSAKPSTTGVASSIVNVGLALGGGAGPLLVGVLIGLGGGFTNVGGYTAALYVLTALMVLAAILTALFTRETTGWFQRRDRALVAARSCVPAGEEAETVPTH
ncbi:MFS transporter (plasmid) [Rhodococcus opacus]|uniref:Major facilitator transporter n=1 Tax=Rhodococcus opacus M213 TaxID=1129896 RepID=K8XKS4_RHOOP|nr:MFS transporter [Rhodococcus opacus]EKT81426.1 major facilitator transporter [Rhodococcus opacus M213]ELB93763.1 major facilitator transporter [Rhodococcus wratislaviensis IFP 2016]WKN59944.1 MFS transporter [Rhodococcus opacus]